MSPPSQAPPAPPPPMRIIPAPPPGEPREWNVITWQVSDVTCGAGTRIAPTRLVLPDPQPQMVAAGSLNGPQTFTISFALDAEGRAFDITSSTEPRKRAMPRRRRSGKGKAEVAALVKALVSGGIGFTGIDIHESSLEDIFVDLLAEEGA